MKRELTKSNTRDVNAAQRVALALELRAQRMSYDEIAHRVGYSGRGAARNAIQRELQRVVVENVDELRREEMDMLDRLHALVWEQLVIPADDESDDDDERPKKRRRKKPGVNLFAVDRVLAISAARRELMGLDKKPEEASGPQVVIREVPVGWVQIPQAVEVQHG